MIFGDVGTFAIESSHVVSVKTAPFGRIVLWIGGARVGNPDEQTALATVARTLTELVARPPPIELCPNGSESFDGWSVIALAHDRIAWREAYFNRPLDTQLVEVALAPGELTSVVRGFAAWVATLE